MKEITLWPFVKIIPDPDRNKLVLPPVVKLASDLSQGYCDYINDADFDFSKVETLDFWYDCGRAVTKLISLTKGVKELIIDFMSTLPRLQTILASIPNGHLLDKLDAVLTVEGDSCSIFSILDEDLTLKAK